MTRNEPWIFAIIVVLSHSSFKGNFREWTQFVPSGTPSPPLAFYFKGYPGYPAPSHSDTPKSLPVHRYDETDEPYGPASPTVRPIVEHPKAILQKQRLGGITQKFASAKTKINPKQFSRPLQPKTHRYSVERTNETRQIFGRTFQHSTFQHFNNETIPTIKSQISQDHLGFLPPKINKSLAVHQFKKVVKSSRKTIPLPTSNTIDLTVDLPTKLDWTRLQNWKDHNTNTTLKRRIDENRKIPIDPKERNTTLSRGFGSVEGSISEGSTDEISSDQTKNQRKSDEKASDSTEFFQNNNNLFDDSIASKNSIKSNHEKNRPSEMHLPKTNAVAGEPVLSPPPPPSPSIPAPDLPRFDD